jgi:hypothetical protein
VPCIRYLPTLFSFAPLSVPPQLQCLQGRQKTKRLQEEQEHLLEGNIELQEQHQHLMLQHLRQVDENKGLKIQLQEQEAKLQQDMAVREESLDECHRQLQEAKALLQVCGLCCAVLCCACGIERCDDAPAVVLLPSRVQALHATLSGLSCGMLHLCSLLCCAVLVAFSAAMHQLLRICLVAVQVL